MASKQFNSVDGYSVGSTPNGVIDANANITAAALTANGNVSFTGANVSLGSNSNVKLTGGSSGQYLQTDGTGNLSWQAVTSSAGSISNGSSNVNIPAANGNIQVSVAGVANVITFASNNAYRGSFGLTGIVSQANTAPSNPQPGDQWYNTFNGILFEYIDDGTSSQWVDVNGLPGVVGPIVLPGGTANAVVYLSSTSETVSSPSFVFDGTDVTAPRFTSTVSTGTAPLTVSSNTLVSNLNADLLDGFNTATANTANTVAVRDASGNVNANFFIGNGSQLTGIITSVSNVSNGTSNLNIPAVNGNINLSVAGNANIAVVTGTGVNVAGTLNVTGNANVGNIGATNGVFTNVSGNGNSLSSLQGANVTGQVANALVAGTVYTAAQPNITSVGTLSSLTATGNVTGGNLTTAGVVAATGNVTGGNLTTAGVVAATGNVSGGNLTTAGVLSVTGTGVSSIAGNLDMTSNTIINLATPTNPTDAATKQYVDDIAQGLHTHDSCNAATNTTLATISGGTVTYNNGASGVGANLTTTGSFTTIDGVTLSNGMRILVKNEANSAHNGIYDRTSTTVLTRSSDFDTPAEMAGGDFTFVSAGTLYDNTGWVMTDAVTTVGTSPVPWVQFSGAGTYTAGTGLNLIGNQFNLANTAVTAGAYSLGAAVQSATFPPGSVTVDAQGRVTAINVSNITSASANGGGTLVERDGSGGFSAGTITANFSGSGAALTALNGSNITTGTVAAARVATLNQNTTGSAATVTTNAQPNITSVGTLTSLAVTGNANVGNLGTAQVLATANITTPQVIANVASGTAPFLVNSNTLVANLNADLLDGFNSASANTANTIALRDASGNLSANFFVGNGSQLTGLSTSSIANGNSNVNIPVANGNVNITAVGNATLVVTGTGANITGTANVTGNLSAGNIITGSGTGGNISGANVITANTFVGALTGAATTAGTVTTAAQPNITSVGTLTDLTVSGNVSIADRIIHTGDTNTAIRFPAADTFTVETSGVERLRITANGDVGIAVVPAVWDATQKALQIGQGGAIMASTAAPTIHISTNTYYSDDYRYITTEAAARYLQFQGSHLWYTAPSGTAGTVATYTERMRVDATGNVGIGTSSPGFKLEVTGDIRLGSGGDLRLGSATGTTTSAGDSSIFNDASDLYFNTGNVNRMYIANDGNVGIGTAGPGYRLDVASADTTAGLGYAMRIRGNATAAAGAIQFTDSGVTTQWGFLAATATAVTLDASGSSVLAFRTNSDERMRITSSGNVGIGITTPAAKLEIMQNQAAFSYLDYYNTTVGGGIVWRQIVRNIANTGTTSVDLAKIGTGFLINNNDTNAANFTAFGVGASERMRITSDGNVGIGTSSPGTYNLNVAGSLRAGDTIDFGNAGTNPSIINVGVGATGNRFAIIDFIGDTTYTDYGFRVGRYNNGANGTSELQHRGTGALSLNAFDAGVILMQTQNIERMRITSGGEVGIGTTAPTYKLEVYGSPAWIRNFAGTPSSPTETQDWPVAAFNVASFGNFSLQTMMAFTLPNDGNYFLDHSVWNFKLDQTASSTTSAGVNGMQFGGPGYLAFMPGGSERFRINASGGITSSDLADAVGYKGLPQNQQTSAYTLVLADMGKHIYATAANFAITIPANATTAFPIGTAITIIVEDQAHTIAPAGGVTLVLAGTGAATTGTRTLAQGSVSTIIKVGTNRWYISGAGVT
jgi:hypothetical protein